MGPLFVVDIEPLRDDHARLEHTLEFLSVKQLDDQVRALLASIAIPDEAKVWLLQGIAKSREEHRAYHQTVVQEIRAEINEQEVLMDRLYDDRLTG